MKKKILFSCICASIIFLSPFTVIAENNRNSIHKTDTPNIVKKEFENFDDFIAQLQYVIDNILIKYGHISIIKIQCKYIKNLMNSYLINYYCFFLQIVMLPLIFLDAIFYYLVFWRDNFISIFLFYTLVWIGWQLKLHCYEHKILYPNYPLKSLFNINRIDISGNSILTGLDECPCMQQ